MTHILEPQFTPQKSFGGKAIVKEGKLYSYETLVAEYKHEKLYLKGYYSKTTAKHIREFAVQNGFRRPTKKEMESRSILTK